MRKLWSWGRWILLVFAAVVGCWLGWTAILRSEFEARLDKLREANEPVELTDLNAAPVPEEDNAAPLLRRAAKLLGDVPYALDGDTEMWDEEEIAEAQKWLDGQTEAIGLLHEAAGKPSCYLGIDWSAGPNTRVDSIPWTQAFTQTLEALARREAAAGRPSEALRCLTTMVRVADHLPRVSVICHLVRATAHHIAMDRLKDVARSPGFDPAAAKEQLLPLVREAARVEHVIRALVTERPITLSVIRNWIDGESPRKLLRAFAILDEGEEILVSSPTDWLWASWIMRPFAYRDGIRFLDNLDDALEALRERDWKALDAMQDRATGLPHMFSSLFIPLFPKMGKEHLRLRARLVVAEVGLDLLEQYERTRTFDIEIPVPTDPYTGQRLFYEARKDGTARVEAKVPIPPAADHPEFRPDYEIAWDLQPPR